MNSPWPIVKLGEVLRLDIDSVSINAATSYPMVGVLSFGRGLFDREPVENGKTSYRVFHRLKADHVVMSQLFGWEGALALSSEQYAGRFVSPKFPTFLCEARKLDRQFLGWLMRRPAFWEDLGSRASGMGDRRRTLNPGALFSCEIPLPPLAEQRRIVARIEELAAKIEEARALRRQTITSTDDLLIALAHRLDLTDTEKERAQWRKLRLGECVDLVDDLCPVAAGRSYPNLGIYSFARGLFHKQPIDGTLTSATVLRRVKTGEFIYSRLFAFEGAYGMVDEKFDGHFVSTEYPTFECRCGIVRAEFLAAHFKAPSVWRIVAEGSKGLGHRRQRVQPARLLAHSLWIPPIVEQNRIADVHAELKRMGLAHAETAVELDALLPSILDRAFRGQL